jgi:hypothetical protein
MAAPPPVTIGPPPRKWPASPVTYVRRGVGARVAGTHGTPGAALSWEVGAGSAGIHGAPVAALRQEVGAGAAGTRGAPGAAPSREVGVGVAGTRGAPGVGPSPEAGAGATGTRGTHEAAREVGAGAAATRDGPGAALSREGGAGAAATRGGPGAALSPEGGAGATATRGGPGATLSREAGTTPPPPLPRPSARDQGVVVPVMPPDNPHQMITRGKTGFKVVPDCLVLTVVTSSLTPSPIPSSARAVFADPHWCATMEDEYGVLISNGTWELVPRLRAPTLSPANGSSRTSSVLMGSPRVDYDETFSPVVKSVTVRTVLATAVSRTRPIQQLDVKNVFLHDTLSETVFCCQPTGFTDPAHPDLVCRLHKFLYGLKQAPRAW